MASIEPSNVSDASLSNHDESPFTTTDFDGFPPLPDLLPSDPVQLADHLDHDMPSRIAQLEQENHHLKTALIEVQSQRQTEQAAYSAFVRSAEGLNTNLPEPVKTPAMRLAMQMLVKASRTYRGQAMVLNQRYDQVEDLLPAASPGQISANLSPSVARSAEGQLSLKRRFSQNLTPAHNPPRFDTKTKYQTTIASIKSTLTQLHISRPRDLQSFEAALAHLKNNINSFAPFIVLYLNGRYKHVTSKLRPQINEVIGGLFDDPEDARLVVSTVMKVLRENVKYVEQDVQGIGSDIIAPMSMLLWALMDLLERE